MSNSDVWKIGANKAMVLINDADPSVNSENFVECRKRLKLKTGEVSTNAKNFGEARLYVHSTSGTRKVFSLVGFKL